MKNIISAGIATGIQLVITAALQKEIPKKWLESHNIPVHSLAALKSGSLSRLHSSHKGILTVITGAGLKASEEAALWIQDNLTPLFVVNIGTCGLLDKSHSLAGWISPRYSANEAGDRIALDSRLPIPSPVHEEKVHSLISVVNARIDTVPEQWRQNNAVDMECYAQAKVFAESGISFHCLKFATDYSDHNTADDFNKHLDLFQEKFKELFRFVSEGASKITAIIPVYNREQTIRRAVDSILAQSYLPEEIIVVDDCSTDGTREILESYGDSITRIYLSENAGPSKARNEGVRHARTEWIAFLDSDDSWEKKKLQVQREFLMKYPFYKIMQSEEKWIRNGVRVNPRKHHEKTGGWIFEPSLHRCLVSPSSVLMKNNLFTQYGYFDEGFPVCEDYDLWLKISRHHPVGLERNFNVNKYGGHDDQLSTTYPVMDRLRVKALAALLRNEAEPIFRDKISSVLKHKLEILINGYEKRHKLTDAQECREILAALTTVSSKE